MRVLIIGGTAFSGPHTVRRLVEAGHEVSLFHRGQSEPDLPAGVQHIHGEQRQLASFAGTFARLRPEVVLHMVAFNAQDAWTLTRMFRDMARRVVAVSSQDVYRAYNRFRRKEPGPPDPAPLAEDAPLRDQLFPYRGESLPGTDDSDRRRQVDEYEKILVERLVMGEPDLPGTILRLPAVYGPEDEQHRIFDYLKRMDDGRPAIVLEEGRARWRWSRGYVENVAQAIALAVMDDRAAGRIYNVAEPEALDESEWVRRIGNEAGWHGSVVAVPAERLPAHLTSDYDWSQHWAADTSRIRAELGYAEAVPREEALRRTIAWERAHPPADAEAEAGRFDYAAEDAALGN